MYMTSSLTLYSLAASMPLTNVISPSSNAMERFKWIKCCVRLKTHFLLYTYVCMDHLYKVKGEPYLNAISATIVNKRQTIDIAHPM